MAVRLSQDWVASLFLYSLTVVAYFSRFACAGAAAWARRHSVLDQLLRVCGSRSGDRERLVYSCLIRSYGQSIATGPWRWKYAFIRAQIRARVPLSLSLCTDDLSLHV